jgi:hypothetical protein
MISGTRKRRGLRNGTGVKNHERVQGDRDLHDRHKEGGDDVLIVCEREELQIDETELMRASL